MSEWLQKKLETYFEDVPPSQGSLLTGKATFADLKLRAEGLLEVLGYPVESVAGFVGRLSITLSLTRVEVELSEVALLCSTIPMDRWDADTITQEWVEWKVKAFLTHELSLLGSLRFEEPALFSGLGAAALQCLAIRLKDVELRIEDTCSRRSKPFVIGFLLSSIDIYLGEYEGSGVVSEHTQDVTSVHVAIQGGVYIDDMNAGETWQVPEDRTSPSRMVQHLRHRRQGTRRTMVWDQSKISVHCFLTGRPIQQSMRKPIVVPDGFRNEWSSYAPPGIEDEKDLLLPSKNIYLEIAGAHLRLEPFQGVHLMFWLQYYFSKFGEFYLGAMAPAELDFFPESADIVDYEDRFAARLLRPEDDPEEDKRMREFEKTAPYQVTYLARQRVLQRPGKGTSIKGNKHRATDFSKFCALDCSTADRSQQTVQERTGAEIPDHRRYATEPEYCRSQHHSEIQTSLEPRPVQWNTQLHVHVELVDFSVEFVINPAEEVSMKASVTSLGVLYESRLDLTSNLCLRISSYKFVESITKTEQMKAAMDLHGPFGSDAEGFLFYRMDQVFFQIPGRPKKRIHVHLFGSIHLVGSLPAALDLMEALSRRVSSHDKDEVGEQVGTAAEKVLEAGTEYTLSLATAEEKSEGLEFVVDVAEGSKALMLIREEEGTGVDDGIHSCLSSCGILVHFGSLKGETKRATARADSTRPVYDTCEVHVAGFRVDRVWHRTFDLSPHEDSAGPNPASVVVPYHFSMKFSSARERVHGFPTYLMRVNQDAVCVSICDSDFQIILEAVARFLENPVIVRHFVQAREKEETAVDVASVDSSAAGVSAIQSLQKSQHVLREQVLQDKLLATLNINICTKGLSLTVNRGCGPRRIRPLTALQLEWATFGIKSTETGSAFGEFEIGALGVSDLTGLAWPFRWILDVGFQTKESDEGPPDPEATQLQLSYALSVHNEPQRLELFLGRVRVCLLWDCIFQSIEMVLLLVARAKQIADQHETRVQRDVLDVSVSSPSSQNEDIPCSIDGDRDVAVMLAADGVWILQLSAVGSSFEVWVPCELCRDASAPKPSPASGISPLERFQIIASKAVMPRVLALHTSLRFSCVAVFGPDAKEVENMGQRRQQPGFQALVQQPLNRQSRKRASHKHSSKRTSLTGSFSATEAQGFSRRRLSSSGMAEEADWSHEIGIELQLSRVSAISSSVEFVRGLGMNSLNIPWDHSTMARQDGIHPLLSPFALTLACTVDSSPLKTLVIQTGPVMVDCSTHVIPDLLAVAFVAGEFAGALGEVGVDSRIRLDESELDASPGAVAPPVVAPEIQDVGGEEPQSRFRLAVVVPAVRIRIMEAARGSGTSVSGNHQVSSKRSAVCTFEANIEDVAFAMLEDSTPEAIGLDPASPLEKEVCRGAREAMMQFGGAVELMKELLSEEPVQKFVGLSLGCFVRVNDLGVAAMASLMEPVCVSLLVTEMQRNLKCTLDITWVNVTMSYAVIEGLNASVRGVFEAAKHHDLRHERAVAAGLDTTNLLEAARALKAVEQAGNGNLNLFQSQFRSKDAFEKLLKEHPVIATAKAKHDNQPAFKGVAETRMTEGTTGTEILPTTRQSDHNAMFWNLTGQTVLVRILGPDREWLSVQDSFVVELEDTSPTVHPHFDLEARLSFHDTCFCLRQRCHSHEPHVKVHELTFPKGSMLHDLSNPDIQLLVKSRPRPAGDDVIFDVVFSGVHAVRNVSGQSLRILGPPVTAPDEPSDADLTAFQTGYTMADKAAALGRRMASKIERKLPSRAATAAIAAAAAAKNGGDKLDQAAGNLGVISAFRHPVNNPLDTSFRESDISFVVEDGSWRPLPIFWFCPNVTKSSARLPFGPSASRQFTDNFDARGGESLAPELFVEAVRKPPRGTSLSRVQSTSQDTLPADVLSPTESARCGKQCQLVSRQQMYDLTLAATFGKLDQISPKHFTSESLLIRLHRESRRRDDDTMELIAVNVVALEIALSRFHALTFELMISPAFVIYNRLHKPITVKVPSHNGAFIPAAGTDKLHQGNKMILQTQDGVVSVSIAGDTDDVIYQSEPIRFDELRSEKQIFLRPHDLEGRPMDNKAIGITAELIPFDTGNRPGNARPHMLQQGVKCLVLYSKYWVHNRTEKNLAVLNLMDPTHAMVVPAKSRTWLPAMERTKICIMAAPISAKAGLIPVPPEAKRAAFSTTSSLLRFFRGTEPDVTSSAIREGPQEGTRAKLTRSYTSKIPAKLISEPLDLRQAPPSTLHFVDERREPMWLGATLTTAPMPFMRTAVIELVPRFQIQNFTQSSVFVTEDEGRNWIRIRPHKSGHKAVVFIPRQAFQRAQFFGQSERIVIQVTRVDPEKHHELMSPPLLESRLPTIAGVAGKKAVPRQNREGLSWSTEINVLKPSSFQFRLKHSSDKFEILGVAVSESSHKCMFIDFTVVGERDPRTLKVVKPDFTLKNLSNFPLYISQEEVSPMLFECLRPDCPLPFAWYSHTAPQFLTVGIDAPEAPRHRIGHGDKQGIQKLTRPHKPLRIPLGGSRVLLVVVKVEQSSRVVQFTVVQDQDQDFDDDSEEGGLQRVHKQVLRTAHTMTAVAMGKQPVSASEIHVVPNKKSREMYERMEKNPGRDFRFLLKVRGVGISIVDAVPIEIMYVLLEEVSYAEDLVAETAGKATTSSSDIPAMLRTNSLTRRHFKITRMQIDNRCHSSTFTTVISRRVTDGELQRGEKQGHMVNCSWVTMGIPSYVASREQMAQSGQSEIVQLKDLEIEVSALKLNIDEASVVALLQYVVGMMEALRIRHYRETRNALQIQISQKNHTCRDHEELLGVPQNVERGEGSSPMYIEKFRMAELRLVINVRSNNDPTVRRMKHANPVVDAWVKQSHLFMADISNSSFTFPSWEDKNVYDMMEDFVWRLGSHWVFRIVKQIHKLLFAIDFGFNPFLLIINIWKIAGEAVTTPCRMKEQGFKGFSRGVLLGVRIFVRGALKSVFEFLGTFTGSIVGIVDSITFVIWLVPEATEVRVPAHTLRGIVLGTTLFYRKIRYAWKVMYRLPLSQFRRRGCCSPVAFCSLIYVAPASVLAVSVAPVAFLHLLFIGVKASLTAQTETRVRPKRAFLQRGVVEDYSERESTAAAALGSWAQTISMSSGPAWLPRKRSSPSWDVYSQIAEVGIEHAQDLLLDAREVPVGEHNSGGWRAACMRPDTWWRKRVAVVAEGSTFQGIVILSIVADVVGFFMIDTLQDAGLQLPLAAVVVGIIVMDVVLRIAGHRARVFFLSKMNTFDFFVAIGSAVDFLLQLLETGDEDTNQASPGPEGLRVIRPLVKWTKASKISQIWRMVRILRMVWSEVNQDSEMGGAGGVFCVLRHHVLYFYNRDELDWCLQSRDVIDISIWHTVENKIDIWYVRFASIDSGVGNHDAAMRYLNQEDQWAKVPGISVEFVPIDSYKGALEIYEMASHQINLKKNVGELS